jgi:hypothetical protein
MNDSVDLVRLYSSTPMPPAGCRWARGRSADVIEAGEGRLRECWQKKVNSLLGFKPLFGRKADPFARYE